QESGRDESLAAARIHGPSRHPSPGAAHRRRQRRDACTDGHAAGEEALRRSQGLAGNQGRPGNARGLTLAGGSLPPPVLLKHGGSRPACGYLLSASRPYNAASSSERITACASAALPSSCANVVSSM